MPTFEDITIRRSELMQEIVSGRPGFLLRWGNSIFLLVLILLIATTWFIKYPDVIKAPAKLTSINAPKPIISLLDSKLIKLHAAEGQYVQAGTILGFIESTASHHDVLSLRAHLDTLQALIDRHELENIRKYFDGATPSLGELQYDYQQFSQGYLSFCNYLSGGFYLTKKELLLKDRKNLQRLHQNLMEEKQMQEQDLGLMQKTFDANEILRHENVISDFDYRIEQSRLISKKLTLPQINSAIISNESQQTEKDKEIAELENTILQQKVLFQQALSTFKSQTDLWIKKYILIAPIAGKIAFASFIQENQQLTLGQPLFFVNPQNSQYFAELLIPQTNFGKVRIDQKVLLKFQSYPFQEYGSVIGKIEFISHIPDEKGYLAKVQFTDGLITTHKTQVQYRDGLTADAEIITKDIRLLKRFYYSVIRHVSE
jgi:multidrug efflux pump subunit AcrA (membrane-fusion protein)